MYIDSHASQSMRVYQDNSKHPSIGAIKDCFAYPLHDAYIGRKMGHAAFMIQPFLPKGAVSAFLKEKDPFNRIRPTLFEKRVLKWVVDLCLGLDSLHNNNLVHRNIQ
jgi:serine/threonine protein kinase